MRINYNVTGSKRKELVQAVADFLAVHPVYLGAPTFAYKVGDCQVNIHGVLTTPDTGGEVTAVLLDMLKQRGFEPFHDEEPASTAETVSTGTEAYSYIVEIPKNGFTPEAEDNLAKIIASKATLLKKALLLHGIMSAIAEFYSQNLATEVKKGMGEKIKNGGTVGRAPIGYKNVRDIDEKGREARTVAIDPERAPLIKLAFEEYSTGQWTVADLAEHLAACGLNTRSTPRIPSQPITLKTLHKVLVNPYYKGVVTYKGVEHPGSHEPLVSAETWEKVQTILASRVNGERNFKHPHFLKSSIYCACCGERMMVSNEKKKDGTVYPYFVCAGRHSKRHPECTTKAVLISAVEEAIEQIYVSYQLPVEVRIMLEKQVTTLVESEKEKYKKELNGLKGQKAKLENKRQKLLEAHYGNAIPLDLLKTEQQKIAKELATIEHEIRIHNIYLYTYFFSRAH